MKVDETLQKQIRDYLKETQYYKTKKRIKC